MRWRDWRDCSLTLLAVATGPLLLRGAHWGLAAACGLLAAASVGFGFASMRIWGRIEAHREHLEALEQLEIEMRAARRRDCERRLFLIRPPKEVQ